MKLTVGKIILSAVVLIAGGTGAAYATGIIDKPNAGLLDKGDWVLDDEIKVQSSAYVHNPNPVRLNVSSLEADYSLRMNGVKLAEGKKEGLYIPQDKNQTLNFTTRLKTENIPKWWVSHLRNDEKSDLEIPIKASMKVGPMPLSFSGYSYTDTIETNIEKTLGQSISKMEGNYSRQVGTGAGLDANRFRISVQDASASFGDVNRRYTELVIPIEVKNRNDYPIPTPQLNGNLKMNDVKIAEFTANNVRTASDTNIPPGDSREVTIYAEMSNSNIDDWFETHIRKQEKTDAELNIYLGFDMGESNIRIPSEDGMKCRFSFATQILVDEKASAEGFKGCSGMDNSNSGSSGSDSDGDLLNDGSTDDSNSTDGSNSSDDDLSGLL